MAGIGNGRNLALALVAGLLAGCTEGGLFAGGGDGEAPVARAATSTRLVERDVEAPQVFQATDKALWDGRPSLGGVWVASPDAVDPERVIIRNPANGKFVIGALFRRERLNPGPKLQISSDAAAALDILAGQPTEISVVALRREEVAEEPAPAAAAAPILDRAETVETTTLAAVAGAAIDKAEGRPARRAAAAAAPPAASGAGAGAGAGAAPSAPTMTAAAVAAPAGAPPAGLVPASAAAAPKPAAPAAKPAAAAGARGLVQIGIFSVEANAGRAAAAVGKTGIPTRTLREESQGKTFWRVVAGPAAAPMTREEMLAKVKAAGFADAYLVSR